MQTKQQAITAIISLMKQHAIKIQDIKAQIEDSHQNKNHAVPTKFFGFMGGILVFCGLSTLVGNRWEMMSSSMHILITLGTGFIFLVLAVLASTYNTQHAKAVTPLFILAAVFETLGMFVTIHELFPSGNDPHYPILIVFSAMTVQQAIIFLRTQKTALLFILMLCTLIFISTAYDLLGIKSDLSASIIGLSILFLSYVIGKSNHNSIAPFWYFVGSFFFFIGAFDLLQDTSFETIYPGLCVFFIYLSTIVRSRTLLFNGTIATICYITYFTYKHFVNTIGWSISLIVLGCILLGVGTVTINIGKKIKQG